MKKKDKHTEESIEQNAVNPNDDISSAQDKVNGDDINETKDDGPEQKTEVIEVNPSDQMQKELDEYKDKYLRLSAEFDNYRKRTLKEKMDSLKYASEDVLLSLLPVVDDFDRAMKSLESTSEIDAVKQGVVLIYNKFGEFLKSKGVAAIDATGKEFNTDFHEAITKIPVQEETMKGKIVDVIQKGYTLNDKVIRFSKVVIGE